MLDQSGDQQRLQFFEKCRTASGDEEWVVKQQANSSSKSPKPRIVPSENPIETLTEVICAETTKKKRYPPSETGNSQRNYEMFIDLIHRMLAYSPEDRIKPEEALHHPFIRSGEQSQSTSPYPQEAALPAASGQRKTGPRNQQD
jgi:serine/threonine protein kinase